MQKKQTRTNDSLNSVIRLGHYRVEELWKIAQTVMVHKHGKPPEKTHSYRPIKLFLFMSKIFKKDLLTKNCALLLKTKQ